MLPAGLKVAFKGRVTRILVNSTSFAFLIVLVFLLAGCHFDNFDGTGPVQVNLSSPAWGAEVTGYATFQITAQSSANILRVELDADNHLLQTSLTATVSFSVNTTSLGEGSHTFTIKAYDSAGNLGISSGNLIVNHSMLVICNGVVVGQDASHPAGASIQKCIDAMPAGGTLALPVGTYYVEQEIFIRKALTLTSLNPDGSAVSLPCYSRDATGAKVTLFDSKNKQSSRCATLIAEPDFTPKGINFAGGGAMVFAGVDRTAGFTPVSHVVLDHLIIDDNRANRTQDAADYCEGPNFCHNVHLYNCDECQLTNSVFDHTISNYNTIAIDSDGLVVTHNLFWDTGYAPYVNNPATSYRPSDSHWSNSFEVQANDRSMTNIQIADNDAIDSSDGSFCFASSGINGTLLSGDVSNNFVAQVNNQNWHAMIIWNQTSWVSPPSNMGIGAGTDPTKALLIHDNLIDCNTAGANVRKCSFGIGVGGQDEFSVGSRVSGLWIYNNTIRNARIGISVNGAGSSGVLTHGIEYVTIVNNQVVGSGIAFNKAPYNGTVANNSDYNMIAANAVGANGLQVGATEFDGVNLAPAGWSAFDTTLACAYASTSNVLPGVFGFCPGFPAP